jgi:hypothetical protein
MTRPQDDHRWAAWIEKGIRRDAIVRRRMHWLSLSFGVGLTTVVTWFLLS